MCIARFDEDTTTAFTDLYTKIDAGELTEDEEGYSNPYAHEGRIDPDDDSRW